MYERFIIGGSNKPLRGQKHTEWEGGVRVVSMLKAVGNKFKNKEINQVVGYIDLFPTLADLVTKKPSHQMDGISIKTKLNGKTLPTRNFFLVKEAVVNDTFKFFK